ncbi:hypothetical protein WG66_000304 [Moniliophthora roreri]|nr:hypothetical protein WG66_000304 [Moniliophthora roreri]
MAGMMRHTTISARRACGHSFFLKLEVLIVESGKLMFELVVQATPVVSAATFLAETLFKARPREGAIPEDGTRSRRVSGAGVVTWWLSRVLYGLECLCHP